MTVRFGQILPTTRSASIHHPKTKADATMTYKVRPKGPTSHT